jgi:hypothetical protein
VSGISRRAHNLPSRGKVLGRERLVKGITRDLLADDRQPTSILLYGHPGVGKTAVALEVGHRILMAHSLRPRKRGRDVVWISSQREQLTRTGALEAATLAGTLGDVVTTICATLGREDILRALPDEQLQLLNAELARRRVLVICDSLDQVADHRVRSMLLALPHPTRVLATSREDLPLGRSLQLKPLGYQAAQKLSLRLDDATYRALTDSQRETLMKACGGIPLALAWSLALLTTGADPSRVLADLEAHSSDLLRFCFDELWQTLSTGARSLLMSLALYRSGASITMAAVTCGMGDTRAREHLLELRHRALVEGTHAWITLLPLTRAYAIGRGDDDREEAGLRRYRWAAEICTAVANALRLPHWDETFTAFDERRSDIEGLLAWSESNPVEPAARRAAVMWADVAYVLFSGGYWDLLLRHRTWATRSLLDQGLVDEHLAALLTWVARVFLLRGEMEERARCFAEAEAVLALEDQGTDFQHALVDFNRASDDKIGGDRVALLESAAMTFAHAGEDRWETMAWNRLGNVLRLGEGEDASIRVAYERAITVAAGHPQEAWARESIALARGNLGILANRAGEHAHAYALLREAEPDITQRFDTATLAMELAIASYHLGKRRRAMTLGRQARRRADRLNLAVPVGESDIHFERETLPRLERWRRPLGRSRDREEEGT